MKRSRLIAIASLIALGGWWVSIQPLYSGERITDAAIQEMFGSHHRVMQQQEENIQALLGAFINGDTESIKRLAATIAGSMNEVAVLYKPDPRQQSAVWQSMVDITTQASLLQSKVEAGLYDQAYDHFAVMTKRCIACHQVRRTWGVFEEPGDPKSVDEAIAIEQKTTNFLKRKIPLPIAAPAQSEDKKPAN